MSEPRSIDVSAAEAVSHDPGVLDREADVDGIRWALVEYSPGSGRQDWRGTPHAGYVVSGMVGSGVAFVLPASPRHRGANEGAAPARLFLIDAIPGA